MITATGDMLCQDVSRRFVLLETSCKNHSSCLKSNKIMISDMLPQGDSASALSGVSYTLPGLFQFSSLIYQYLGIIKKKFSLSLDVKYIYGAPPSLWNGGRCMLSLSAPTIPVCREEIKKAKEHGITPLLTFSNMMLTQDDLHDPYCNQLLNLLEETKGGVIASSPLLINYIRTAYPSMEIHASVTLAACQSRRTLRYYEKLSTEHDYYVIHPDDLTDHELMECLPKDNAQILVNERCLPHCKKRCHHYKIISHQQYSLCKTGGYGLHIWEGCESVPEWKQAANPHCNLSLSLDEVMRLVATGFQVIKLQGRLDNLYVFFFDLMRFTLEPKVAFSNIFPIFSGYIQKYLEVKCV